MRGLIDSKDSIGMDSNFKRPLSVIWGCELSRERDSYSFQAPEARRCGQRLSLCAVCMGELAQDEFHVVELVLAEDGAAVPLAMLKPSVLPTAVLQGMELMPPVTFHLSAGSGPVYISGKHFSMVPNLSKEEDAEEEEPVEESPKGQAARKGSTAKSRLEKEDELGEEPAGAGNQQQRSSRSCGRAQPAAEEPRMLLLWCCPIKAVSRCWLRAEDRGVVGAIGAPSIPARAFQEPCAHCPPWNILPLGLGDRQQPPCPCPVQGYKRCL
ncbi:nucleoplasmin-2 isoform X2 [Strigops habroptila]|uniref:nucleoplasmin-2 isoform X2 n=1 Tax=Strigops habroptila TaxID=2489341 RepID=UPI0011CF7358|nr:nucleoplasmin-2 isoform X2 [Strigops habroptila]